MKPNFFLSLLLLVASVQSANAQAEHTIAKQTGVSENLDTKDQEIRILRAQIASLKAEIADLKGETPAHSDLQAEAIPIIPDTAPALPSTPAASENTYTVVAGDGLMKIARKTNCKAAEIAAVNDISLTSIIHPGQVLKLPAGSTVAATPPRASVVEEALQQLPVQSETYKIKDGETYYSISRSLKISLSDLMAANPKVPANRLYTGRIINLPTDGAVPAPVATPAPAADTIPMPTAEPASVAESIPEASTEQASAAAAAAAPSQPTKEIIAVSVNNEISYGDFAAQHGTDTERLNSLNDLNLTSATILAKGSELYVPNQP